MKLRVVSQQQIYKYFSIHIIASIIVFVIGLLMQQSGFSALYGVIIGAGIGLVITFISLRLASRRPDQFFASYGKNIISSWLHYPLLIIIILTNIFIAAINLWEVQDFILQFYLESTPSWIVVALSTFCVGYTARYGLKSVFRAAEGVFYLSLLTFLIVPFLIHSNIEWFMAQGFLTHASLSQAWPSGYYAGAIFGEASLLLYIYPYISQEGTTRKTTVKFFMLSLFIIMLHVFPILIILGPDLSQNLNYPELEVIRLIKSGSYLETLDPIIIGLWLISILIKLSFFIFVISHLISKMVKLKGTRSLVAPVSIFIAISSLSLAESHTQLFNMHGGGIFTFIYLAQCIPIIYYVVDSIRNKPKAEEKETS